MKVYMLVLSGVGETEIKVVDKETFDWINNPAMGKPKGCSKKALSWDDQLVPASQVAKIKAESAEMAKQFDMEDDNPEGAVMVTAGSYNNDRACYARSLDGYASFYSNIKDVNKAIEKNGDVLEDDYLGCLY